MNELSNWLETIQLKKYQKILIENDITDLELLSELTLITFIFSNHFIYCLIIFLKYSFLIDLNSPIIVNASSTTVLTISFSPISFSFRAAQ